MRGQVSAQLLQINAGSVAAINKFISYGPLAGYQAMNTKDLLRQILNDQHLYFCCMSKVNYIFSADNYKCNYKGNSQYAGNMFLGVGKCP